MKVANVSAMSTTLCLVMATACAAAQQSVSVRYVRAPQTGEMAAVSELPGPESPQPQTARQRLLMQEKTAQPSPIAPLTMKYIPADWEAQPLSGREKINLTLHDMVSSESLIGFAVAGGYSHLVNGQPNYGTNSVAFGKRVGAAALRDSSQDFLEGAVFAPLLHGDPRYYREGPSHSVAQRTFYALTRPLVGRSDDGDARINYSLLLGYASAAALTQAYYPDLNRNAKNAADTFGSSLGGAALGFLFHEFKPDVVQRLRRHKSS